MSRAYCRRRYCGTALDVSTDTLGRVAFACSACARNKRGLCRECPARLADPHGMRCPACSTRRRQAQCREHDRERYAKRRRATLARWKAKNREPEWRAYRVAYMEAYRAAHPRDGLDRAYNRAYMAKRRANPTYRAVQNARRRMLRALKRGRAA